MRNVQVDEMIKLLKEQRTTLKEILKQLRSPASKTPKSGLIIPSEEESRKEVEKREDCVRPEITDSSARKCFKKILGGARE